MGSLWKMRFFVVKVDKMLGGTKSVRSIAAGKIRKLGGIGSNGMEPLIKDGMKLGGHPSGVGNQYKRQAAGVAR